MSAAPSPVTVQQSFYAAIQALEQDLQSGIFTDAGQCALNNIVKAGQYRDVVFQKWTQGYFDVTENRCFDCHELIGIPGGGYCLKCAIRHGIVD